MNQLFNQAKAYLPNISENLIDLIVNLLVMILIGRVFGQRGLGIYSYFLSIFLITGYLGEFGVPRYVERETALNHNNPTAQSILLASAYKAVTFAGICIMVLFFIFAIYQFPIIQKSIAFIIIGPALLFRGINRLKLAYLQGVGEHRSAARLKIKKRLVFMIMVIIFLVAKLAPTLLLLSFLFSELYIFFKLRRIKKRTWINHSLHGLKSIRSVYREGYKNLFADDAMDVLLYIDFLILGLFTSTQELGIYAEASIIARFFLLIPLSIRPIIRQRYCTIAGNNSLLNVASSMKKTSIALFTLHAIMALFITLHFPDLLQSLFRTTSEEVIGFWIFSAILPGLLFFSAVIAIEPIYEAMGWVETLRKSIMTSSFVNLVLNIYLVPFARYFGAATATMISMFVYFFLFVNKLPKPFQFQKITFLSAGASIYIIYAILHGFKTGLMINIFSIPIFVLLIFWMVGFFQIAPSLEGKKEVS